MFVNTEIILMVISKVQLKTIVKIHILVLFSLKILLLKVYIVSEFLKYHMQLLIWPINIGFL